MDRDHKVVHGQGACCMGSGGWHAMFCKHPGHDGPEQLLKFTVKTAIRVFSLV